MAKVGNMTSFNFAIISNGSSIMSSTGCFTGLHGIFCSGGRGVNQAGNLRRHRV
jgi:hypothetical protein